MYELLSLINLPINPEFFIESIYIYIYTHAETQTHRLEAILTSLTLPRSHFDIAWPKLWHKNGVFGEIFGCSGP